LVGFTVTGVHSSAAVAALNVALFFVIQSPSPAHVVPAEELTPFHPRAPRSPFICGPPLLPLPPICDPSIVLDPQSTPPYQGEAAAVERAERSMSQRYESKLGEIESAMRELVLQNRALKAELRRWTSLEAGSVRTPATGGPGGGGGPGGAGARGGCGCGGTGGERPATAAARTSAGGGGGVPAYLLAPGSAGHAAAAASRGVGAEDAVGGGNPGPSGADLNTAGGPGVARCCGGGAGYCGGGAFDVGIGFCSVSAGERLGDDGYGGGQGNSDGYGGGGGGGGGSPVPARASEFGASREGNDAARMRARDRLEVSGRVRHRTPRFHPPHHPTPTNPIFPRRCAVPPYADPAQGPHLRHTHTTQDHHPPSPPGGARVPLFIWVQHELFGAACSPQPDGEGNRLADEGESLRRGKTGEGGEGMIYGVLGRWGLAAGKSGMREVERSRKGGLCCGLPPHASSDAPPTPPLLPPPSPLSTWRAHYSRVLLPTPTRPPHGILRRRACRTSSASAPTCRADGAACATGPTPRPSERAPAWRRGGWAGGSKLGGR
jgi:hypothetical protein